MLWTGLISGDNGTMIADFKIINETKQRKLKLQQMKSSQTYTDDDIQEESSDPAEHVIQMLISFSVELIVSVVSIYMVLFIWSFSDQLMV